MKHKAKKITKGLLVLLVFLLVAIAIPGTFADDTIEFTTPDLVYDEVLEMTTIGLTHLMNEAINLTSNQMTNEFWDFLADEIANAQEMLQHDESSLLEIHNQIEQLVDAITMLDVWDVENAGYDEYATNYDAKDSYDQVENQPIITEQTITTEIYIERVTQEAREILQMLFAFVRALNQEEFTEGTWNQLNEQLTHVINLLDNETSLSELHQKIQNIVMSIAMLEKVDQVEEDIDFELDYEEIETLSGVINQELEGDFFYVSEGETATLAEGALIEGTIYVSGTLYITGGEIGPSENPALARLPQGPDRLVINGGTVTMSDGLIGSLTPGEGNTAASGGGVNITNGGVFNMTGGTISGNTSTTSSGGGVQITNGTFNMSGDAQIHTNTAATGGGGIRMVSDTNSIFTMTGKARIYNNTSATGGGVSVGRGTTFIMKKDARIDTNTASATGGGVHVDADGIFVMDGGTIDGNISGAGGGGVNVVGTFTMNNGNIGSNRGVHGGGIQIINGTFNMTGGRIENNGADMNGGGVRVAGDNRVEFMMRAPQATEPGYDDENHELPVIANNRANNGGGVSIEAGTFYMQAGSIENHKHTNVTPNETISAGGGVLISGSAMMHMSGGVIKDNAAAGTSAVSAGGGGGVHLEQSATMNITGGVIEENTATGFGGGISLTGTGTLTMRLPKYGEVGYDDPAHKAPVIRNNRALNGGGVGLSGGIFNMSIGIIEANEANSGGGIIITTQNSPVASSFYMTGGEVRKNEAILQGGGITVATTSVADLSGGTIENNKSGSQGGGIQVANAATVHLSEEIHILDNESTRGGGVAILTGIANSVPTLNMSGGIIEDNEAFYGGGVYTGNNAIFNLLDGTIFDNRAIGLAENHGGGGVYVEFNGAFVMHDGSIMRNTAAGTLTTNGGGGIRIFGDDATFDMHGGTIGGIDASAANRSHHGAGVDIQDGTFTMDGGIIHHNKATGFGGGVRFIGTGSGEIEAGAISHNTANQGAGIGLANQGTITVKEKATISHNSATEIGGGIHGSDTSSITLNGASVIHNRAEYGGGIHVAETASLIANGAFITNNTATGNGGGIFTERHNYVLIFPSGNLNNYTNLMIDSSVVFTDNEAQDRSRPPVNPEILTHINFASSSIEDTVNGITGYRHVLNNYDINYFSNALDLEFIKTDESIYDLALDIADVVRLNDGEFTLERYAPNEDDAEAQGTWQLVGTAISGDNENNEVGLVKFEEMIAPGMLYRLTETVAPPGFRRPSGHWYIRIDENGMVEGYPRAEGSWILAFRNHEGEWLVGNMREIELPAAGGLGTTGLTVLGTLLLGQVVVLYIRQRIKDELEVPTD